MNKQVLKNEKLTLCVMDQKYYIETPITNNLRKSVSDLSINVDTCFMFAYWGYEYLFEVSKMLITLEKEHNITLEKILEKSNTRIKILKDGKHVIEIDDVEIKNFEHLEIVLNDMGSMYGPSFPITIKLKVRFIDFFVFEDLIYIGYY